MYVRVVSPDSDAVSNSGIVALERSLLLFDTHFTPEAGSSLLAAARKVDSKPVRYVVNSHAHQDHTHGNQALDDPLVIASYAARRNILESDIPSLDRTRSVAQRQLQKLRQEAAKESDPEAARRYEEQIRAREKYLEALSRLKIVPPLAAAEGSLTIREGAREVRILSLGWGHSEGDIVLLIPDRRIAFMGDLFFNNAIPNVQDASILSWMKALERALTLEADAFVPGHGPVGSKQDLARFLEYFKELEALVRPQVERGIPEEEAVKNASLPTKYSSYLFQNFFPSNIQKMYAEIKAHASEEKPPAADD